MEEQSAKRKSRPSEALYDRCSQDAAHCPQGVKKTFTQDDLIRLCDIPELKHISRARDLLPLISELTDSMHFIVLRSKAGSCWSLRPRDAASKIKKLGVEDRMVYTTIEEAHDKGVWLKTIKTRTNIRDSNLANKIINRLEGQKLIKQFKTKGNAQKYYILYHLAPNDDATGGSFYDAGDLDESLIDELSNLIVFHVRQMSWVEERKKRIKREYSPILIRDDAVELVSAGAHQEVSRGRKKRKRDSASTTQPQDIEDSAPPRKHRSHKHAHDPETDAAPTQLTFPAGHEYPNPASIHQFITQSDILRGIKAQSLTVDEIQNVLNVMVWDGKLECINGGYRTVRGIKSKLHGEPDDEDEEMGRRRGNALTEMPCGRCPVIDLCGNGGPINAKSCVYFEKWLGLQPDAAGVKAEEVAVA